MSKARTVIKYELINTITRKSFLIALILVPLIPSLIVGALGLMNQGQRESVQEIISPDLSDMLLPEAYIDHSGLIQSLPEGMPESIMLAYSDEVQANQDLRNGKLRAYYIVPENYIETGDVTFVTKEGNPVTDFSQTGTFDSVILYNLFEGDIDQFNAYYNPFTYHYVNLKPESGGVNWENPLTFYLPYGITFLFYILIMMNASQLLNNISKEKENRVMELLLSSIKPVDLFTGKILAIGLTGLLQLVVWLGTGLLILNFGGNTLNIPETLQLPPSLLFWGITFFLLGYALFGSLMAGVGAMVPHVKEASQATMILVIPMVIPLMFISALIQEPNSKISMILSLIPFTAPTSMMTRLAAGIIPIWQPILSAGLLLISVILIIRGVARLFRTQSLLTGQKLTMSGFLKALMRKA